MAQSKPSTLVKQKQNSWYDKRSFHKHIFFKPEIVELLRKKTQREFTLPLYIWYEYKLIRLCNKISLHNIQIHFVSSGYKQSSGLGLDRNNDPNVLSSVSFFHAPILLFHTLSILSPSVILQLFQSSTSLYHFLPYVDSPFLRLSPLLPCPICPPKFSNHPYSHTPPVHLGGMWKSYKKETRKTAKIYVLCDDNNICTFYKLFKFSMPQTEIIS